MMNVLGQAHQIVWGSWTLVTFLGVGIFFTLKCHFFQIGGFLSWWSRTAGRLISGEASRKEDGTGEGKGISQFQSAYTALAVIVGTDNIVGMTTALTTGGPGALFQVWVSTLIGMMTIYTEIMLGTRYRHRGKDGHYIYSPLIYMGRGLGPRGMGALHNFPCLINSLRVGSVVQANSAISTMEYAWHVPVLAGGLIFTDLLVLVIQGGIRKIGSVAGKLVPAASGTYITLSIIMIPSCLEQIPGALTSMVASTFRPEAVAGETAGYVISHGMCYDISWGVFSSKAELGTPAVLHGPTESTTPHEQGMWAVFEAFFDTVVLCILAALVILRVTSSSPEIIPYGGATLAAWCFGRRSGIMGEYLVNDSMIVFVFATIMAWFYLRRQAVTCFIGGCEFGENAQHIPTAEIYPLLFITATSLGSETRLRLVWSLSDIWNRLITFPSLATLLFLSRGVAFPKGFLKGRD